MDLHPNEAKLPHLLKRQKMSPPEFQLPRQLYRPPEYPKCNLHWSRNAQNGSRNSNRELLKSTKLVSRYTLSSLLQEESPKRLKPLSNHTSPSSISMRRNCAELQKEGYLGQVTDRVEAQAGVHLDQAIDLDREPLHPTPARCLRKRKRSLSPTSRGLYETSFLETSSDLNSEPRSNRCKRGQLTLNRSERASLTRHDAPLSQTPSGSILSKGNLLTSTMSSLASTPPLLKIREPKPSVNLLSSNSERRMHQNQSALMAIGPSHSTSPRKLTYSLSPIELKSSNPISDTSFNSSQLSRNPNTCASSPLIKPSGNAFRNAATSSYPISTNSGTYKPCTSTIMAPQNQLAPPDPFPPETNHLLRSVMNPVEIGIKECVDEGKVATTSMSANDVSKKVIPATSARERALQEVLDLRAK